MLQVLQQVTGINPFMGYGTFSFNNITNTSIYSAFFLYDVHFLSTIPSVSQVDTFGRRELLLIGIVGVIFDHRLATIQFAVVCDGNVDDAGCSLPLVRLSGSGVLCVQHLHLVGSGVLI
ncbi:Sugar transport protein 10 [Phytophthora cinnamomi]|uniref:Sugar transport protein 10 n=1 Tax=Phytophthora cinnamomi TaxID=4785 RepID=UPI00355AB5FB|nr:Sugar transport protein 10 [Phytophthora cinnamomi]